MRTKYAPNARAMPDHENPQAITPTTAATCTPQNAKVVARRYDRQGTREGVCALEGACGMEDIAVFVPRTLSATGHDSVTIASAARRGAARHVRPRRKRSKYRARLERDGAPQHHGRRRAHGGDLAQPAARGRWGRS